MATNKKQLLTMPAEMQTIHTQRRLPRVNEGLKLLNPKGMDEEEYKNDFEMRKRLPYSGMRAHMELAAQAFAVGATDKMASQYAGISVRQIKKYKSDADFRGRIEELRTLLTSKIRGKVIREIDRRTSPEMIKKMELLDLLRVGDRVGLGRGAVEAEGPGGGTNYDLILQQVFLNGTGGESETFPVYGPDIIPIPGSDTPIDG